MAKGFDNLHLKAAVKSHNKFDLSFNHLTTMNFGQILPLFAQETVVGDKFNVQANYFSRMAPLVKPTYGKFTFNTVTSFVPYYQVCDGIDAYMAGNTVWEGRNIGSRYITYREFVYFVVNYCCSYISLSEIKSSDISLVNVQGSRVAMKYTQIGKYYMKIMNSLGYQFPESVDLQTGSTWSTTVGVTKLSALPLLAFFKAYNDYMSQSQRFNTSQLTSYLSDIRHNHTIQGTPTKYNAGNYTLSSGLLKEMFDLVFLQYENDYFTSAWADANAPLLQPGDVNTGLVIPSAAPSDEIQFADNDNYLLFGTESTTGLNYLGQRSLDFLKAFDDWVRRNNYSGSRAVQKIYSRFGIKTEDYKSNYAHVIDTTKESVQVGDVMAMADTTGSTLGDYAGKGIMNSQKGFSYEAKDYGMLFVFGYYTVAPMMSFGCDRHVLRTNPYDYYNPEFDGLGAEAISYAEAFENPNYFSGDSYNSLNVYGFTERYNSYRYGRDKITGEFRKLCYNANGSSAATDWNVWHTGRDLSAVRASGNMFAQSTSMNSLSPVNSEYNRMFSITTGDEDKFYLTCLFKVTAVRPMLSLNQVPRLGQGDTTISRNGNVIN